MKRSFILSASLCLHSLLCTAQNAFLTYGVMDVNNIAARSYLHGDHWLDPITYRAHCHLTGDSSKIFGDASAIWMGAFDATSSLYVSAQTYRQDGNDFWPGPISNSPDTFQQRLLSLKWAKIWSVKKLDIVQFLSQPVHTVTNTPPAILDWPGKGNPWLRDAAGDPLVLSGDGAPFVDVDHNGSYNALQGDYPAMKGDRMLWWLNNDRTLSVYNNMTIPLGVEIANSVYAYNRGTEIDNVIFYSYEVTNRSVKAYTGFRFGFWNALRVGDPYDDYLLYDSTKRIMIEYNSDGFDYDWQADLPSVAFMVLELPGDALNIRQELGSALRYENDFSPHGNPRNGLEFSNYLHGRDRTGAVWPMGWTGMSNCGGANPRGSHRFVLSSGDYTLLPGQSRRFSGALLMALNNGGCPNIDFAGLYRTADTAWEAYWKEGYLATGLQSNAALPPPGIFPNPARTEVRVNTLLTGDIALQLYDAAGRQASPVFRQQGQQLLLNVAQLPAGLYYLRCSSGAAVQHGSFLKE